MGQLTKTNTEIEDPTHLSANHSTDVQSDFNRKKGYLFGFVHCKCLQGITATLLGKSAIPYFRE